MPTTQEAFIRRRPLRSAIGPIYARFGLSAAEICDCALCGVTQERALADTGYGLIPQSVPISRHCPVFGVIGLCHACLVDRLRTKRMVAGEAYGTILVYDEETDDATKASAIWLPPRIIRPIVGVRAFVLARAFSDDDRLAGCLAATWAQIPSAVQQTLTEEWMRPSRPFVTTGGLRLEALPSWPTRGTALCQYFHRSHAIRLRSRTVNPMPDDLLRNLTGYNLAWAFFLRDARVGGIATDT